MPALPHAAKTIKVDMHWTVGSDTSCLNRLHFRYTTAAPSAADLLTLATAVRTNFVLGLSGYIESGVNLTSVYTQDIDSAVGNDATDTTQYSGAGSGGILPGSACTLMNHRIARRYRGGKPRTYLPLGGQANLQNQTSWTAAYQNSMNTGWATFIASIVGHTFGTTALDAFVNVSYYTGKLLRVTPVVEPITASSCNAKIGSQRRGLLHSA